MQYNNCLRLLVALSALLQGSISFAQTRVEGYVYEKNNRGFLNQASVYVYPLSGKIVPAKTMSDESGHFMVTLPFGKYRFLTHKDKFDDREDTIQVEGVKLFLKMEMQRHRGYIFDARLIETTSSSDTSSVRGASIEIYNRNRDKVEMNVKRSGSTFKHILEQGSYYTILIRKLGYLSKRIDIDVNARSCNLCMDGLRSYRQDVMLRPVENDSIGLIMADVEMEPVYIGKHINIPIVYYDYDNYSVPPDTYKSLDKLILLLKDNPGLSFEIGSHMDARGNDEYNLKLSQKRADAIYGYMIGGGVNQEQITAKGYGETKLLNGCANGVNCTEAQHLENRRTELVLTGVASDSLISMQWTSLEQLVEEEKIDARSKEEAKSVPTVPRPSNLPPPMKTQEANSTVPLPEFKGTMTEEMPAINDVLQSGAPLSQDPQSLSRNARTANVSPLDSMYTGLAIQLLRSQVELKAAYTAFRDFDDISWKKEADGLFYYYLTPKGTLPQVRNYYKKTIKPNYRDARLLRFGANGKVYLK